MSTDKTNSEHYKPHGIFTEQPIDIMRQSLTADAFKGFLVGNVIKYVARYDKKNGREDLDKAKVYIDYLIAELDDILPMD